MRHPSSQGSGFLGVPRGFHLTGTLLGILLLGLITLLANISKNYILDAMVRAEAITRFLLIGNAATPAPRGGLGSANYGALRSDSADTEGGGFARLDGPATGDAGLLAMAAIQPEADEDEDRPTISIKLPPSAAPGDGRARAGSNSEPRPPARPKGLRSLSHDGSAPVHAIPRYEVTSRKFELTELVEMFLGASPRPE